MASSLILVIYSTKFLFFSTLYIILVVVVALSLHAKILGEGLKIHSPPVLFKEEKIIKWRSAHAHQFHFVRLRSDHSSTASWELLPSVSWRVVCELVFPDRFPHYDWWHGRPTPTLSGQSACMFRCNLPPAILAEWLWSFVRHCGNRGGNTHRTRVSTEN